MARLELQVDHFSKKSSLYSGWVALGLIGGLVTLAPKDIGACVLDGGRFEHLAHRDEVQLAGPVSSLHDPAVARCSGRQLLEQRRYVPPVRRD
jgi:hypothetical protein